MFTCDIQSITKQCARCQIYYAGHVFLANVSAICHEKSMDFQECCWTMGHLITVHHSLGLHFGTSCVEWPSITFPTRPQERHLLSRPLCVVAYMHRDGFKLIFLLLPLDVTHNNGLRKAINPCDILVVTVHDFTNLICNSPTLFPLNLKQCYEFSPPLGEENPIHPLVFPDILPWLAWGSTPGASQWHMHNLKPLA